MWVSWQLARVVCTTWSWVQVIHGFSDICYVGAQVYNIGPYLRFHPGGHEILLKAAGTDCTKLFDKYHAWVNADMLLEACLLGMLASPNETAS